MKDKRTKKKSTGPRQRRKNTAPAPRNRRSGIRMSDYGRMVDRAEANSKKKTAEPCVYCGETVETDDVCGYCGVACHPDGAERTQHCLSFHELDCDQNPDNDDIDHEEEVPGSSGIE